MHKNTTKMSEDKMFPMMQEQCEVFQSSYSHMVYDIPLDEHIREPAYYRQVFQVFKQAQEGDLIRLNITNGGGRIDSAIIFMNLMAETQAEVVAVLEGDTHSAASMIALCAHNVIVKPFASMMIHHASFGAYNTVQNVVDQVTFTSKQTEELIRKVYKFYLSEEEIEQVIRNREIWLNHNEIGERLDIMFEAKAKEPCDCGSPDCAQNQRLAQIEEEEDFEEVPTLSEIIADAVEQGVKKALAARDAKEKKAQKVVKIVEKAE